MNTDSQSLEMSDPITSIRVVVVACESDAEVERRGPFTEHVNIDGARKALYGV